MTIFEGMDVVLPATTRVLQGLSSFFEVYGLIVLLVVRLIYMLIKRIFSSEEGRERLDNWLLTAPLIKTVVRPNLFGQLSRTLGALLQNGVPVLTALRITENVIQNKAIQKAIEMTREGVTDGKTIAQPMARSGQFDKLMVDLVHIGEQTGDVPAALNNLAETYDDTLMVNLQRVTAMIGPALIVWIAGLVGFMLMGVLQAMFKITGTIGQ
jgi:type II secretory pathway component PulF|tara:strand:- start:898 stop:1530 length:633 start_codon:yes stop_codon:yes gene_type:complete